MSELHVTIKMHDGREETFPFMQMLRVTEVMKEFEHAVWHRNDCGCCVTVHERDKPVTWGYVVNQHGEAFREESPQRRATPEGGDGQ